jgi:glycosyltransferase involved in cell wall biosynthesis
MWLARLLYTNWEACYLPAWAAVLKGSSFIAVLPNRAGSVSEFTSPLKLFEYMASGCAIVVSDLPVLREILAEDEAAWFQPGDPKGLADAIRQLAGDPVLAKNMGERLAERAKEYSWQARAGRLLQTFMAVTGSSPNENTRNES